MNNSNLKSSFALLALFMLDITVPVHFLINTEFVMLGVIFLGLRLSSGFVFFMAVFFGIAKDALMFNKIPVSTMTFVLTVILVRYLRKHFQKKIVFEFAIASIAIIINLIINSVAQEAFSIRFSFSFIVQSLVMFALLDLLLKKWISDQTQKETL